MQRFIVDFLILFMQISPGYLKLKQIIPSAFSPIRFSLIIPSFQTG